MSKQDLENGSITFIIRLDEYTKEIKIDDFTLSASDMKSTVSYAGGISNYGTDVVKIHYNPLDGKEEKYEWKIELRFYSEKVGESL